MSVYKGREREYQREWQRNNREKRKAAYCPKRERDKKLKELYGMSQADFDALLAKQGGKCAVCGSPEHRGRNWHVDHDHATGRVRGILCKSCNIGLGQLGDDAYRVSALLNYPLPPELTFEVL